MNFLVVFFNEEMLSGSVHLDHRMSVKISRAIPPLSRAALGRKRSADCLHNVAHPIGDHQIITYCFLPAAVTPTHPLIRSSSHPLSSFGLFFFLLTVAGDLRVCMHRWRPLGLAEVKGHALPTNTPLCQLRDNRSQLDDWLFQTAAESHDLCVSAAERSI